MPTDHTAPLPPRCMAPEGRQLVREAIAGNPNLTIPGFMSKECYRDLEKRRELRRQRLEEVGLQKNWLDAPQAGVSHSD